MDSQSVIRILREHEQELKAAGIIHLRLFGSTARGQSSPGSDIDLLADFDLSKKLTRVSIGHIQSRLEDLLGANIDLTSAEWMKDPVRSAALTEALLAF